MMKIPEFYIVVASHLRFPWLSPRRFLGKGLKF